MDQSDSRSNCLWQGCSLLLVLGLAGVILLFAEWRAQAAERDARAPVVIDRPVAICRLSPSGRFLFIGADGVGQFYDLAQQVWVDLSLEAVMQGPGGNFWLRDNHYFVFHTWREEHDAQGRIRIPTDGHVIDLIGQTISDITTLPVSEQTAILQLAAERELITSRDLAPFTSPDGQYKFWDFFYRAARIYHSSGMSNDPQAVVNEIQGHPAVYPCLPGWRMDSQGYYFIDRGGPMAPNPVRLLLTHAPFPLWLWLWRAFGIAVSVALVVVAWRLRR